MLIYFLELITDTALVRIQEFILTWVIGLALLL